MSDQDRRRTIELSALASALDANGRLDLNAFAAQRLILSHQRIDGIDANALVAAIVASPAYQQAPSGEAIEPVLEAVRTRLSTVERGRFAAALDKANVNEHWTGIFFEDYLQAPAEWTARQISSAAGWTDEQISGSLRDARRWAQGIAADPSNPSFLREGAGALGADIGDMQFNYGAIKGAARHGLSSLGEVVDTAEFAFRFTTDENYRNLIVSSARLYAARVVDDPSTLPRDAAAAVEGAWDRWNAGLEQAKRNGTEQEYLGQGAGVAGVELVATMLPPAAIARATRLARLVDAGDDAVPDAADNPRGTRGLDSANDVMIRNIVDGRNIDKKASDDLYAALAGLRRDQGELDSLIDGARRNGDLPGLLNSGALNPRELNYLARKDPAAFPDQEAFTQSINAWLPRLGREPNTKEIGDIGEAQIAYSLASDPDRKYSVLMPIQNNSGQGNDMVGFNSQTGRWEIYEVKASGTRTPPGPSGDPDSIILRRLEAAIGMEGRWAPKNVWESESAEVARRILNETRGSDNTLDLDAYWARAYTTRQADGSLTITNDPPQPWPRRQDSLESTTPDRDPSQAAVAVSPRDQALFARVRGDAPGDIPDATVWRGVEAARQNGLERPDQIGRVALVGQQLWIAGATPGYLAMVDTSAAPAPIAATQERLQEMNREQELQYAAAAAQSQREEQGRTMRG